MNKSWMPKTAGILDIVAGSLSILGVTLVFLGITIFQPALSIDIPNWVRMLVSFIAIPRLLIDILAIIGGIFSLYRKFWGLALAGSIAAVFSRFILGIPALVFIIWGKDQFK